MIQYIEVDGFRSLSKFRFDVKPGLNVLIGPNGSGKTNIVLFFQFLSSLVETTLSNAVSRLGGAGSIFRKIGENYQRELSVEVYGVIQISSKSFWIYRYCFGIELSQSGDSIFFNSQRLSLKRRTVESHKGITEWDLDIVRALDADGKPSHQIKALDKKRLKFNEHFIQVWSSRQKHGTERTKKGTEKSQEQLIIDLFSDSFDPNESLLRSFGLRALINASLLRGNLIRDLTSSALINIVPSHVRLPEDSAKTPGIQQDGSGLYSTLYALVTPQRERSRSQFVFQIDTENRIRRVKIQEIVAFLKVANPAIDKLEIKHNSFDNQVQVRVYVDGKSEKAVLPLSAMSDGTLKWLALVTAIKTSRNTLSVEEPENYLHPLMQKEVLQIIRSSLSTTQFSLLTTHSETILNNADPAEVVVVYYEDGETRATRPANVETLREEINKTGFGLGYYYLSGSLDPDLA